VKPAQIEWSKTNPILPINFLRVMLLGLVDEVSPYTARVPTQKTDIINVELRYCAIWGYG
jgi:hypothetical protein